MEANEPSGCHLKPPAEGTRCCGQSKAGGRVVGSHTHISSPGWSSVPTTVSQSVALGELNLGLSLNPAPAHSWSHVVLPQLFLRGKGGGDTLSCSLLHLPQPRASFAHQLQGGRVPVLPSPAAYLAGSLPHAIHPSPTAPAASQMGHEPLGSGSSGSLSEPQTSGTNSKPKHKDTVTNRETLGKERTGRLIAWGGVGEAEDRKGRGENWKVIKQEWGVGSDQTCPHHVGQNHLAHVPNTTGPKKSFKG